MTEVLIVAAEASSALFAQRLLEHWRDQGKRIKAFGVGTASMEDLGFERLGKAEEMAVVGFAEVLEKYGHLKNVFQRLVDTALHRRPKFALVLDYPGFNLRLAKELHEAGIPVIYYVSPQVWAWKKDRVKQIKKYCKKILVLFPFEVEFYQREAVPVEFVGHPLLDEISSKYFDSSYIEDKKGRFGFSSDNVVIGLMPGSRRSEIQRHMPLQIQVAEKLSQEFNHLKFSILVAPTLTKENIQEFLPSNVSISFVMMRDNPPEMICPCDLMLAASGTATLMVALLGKPMVIMYNVNWITYLIAKAIAYNVDLIGLPNLILGRQVVPEKIQSRADDIVGALRKYLSDPDYMQTVREELQRISSLLGDKGATVRVAKSLEVYL